MSAQERLLAIMNGADINDDDDVALRRSLVAALQETGLDLAELTTDEIVGRLAGGPGPEHRCRPRAEPGSRLAVKSRR